MRVRAYRQELSAFYCHICHRLYDNPLFLSLIDCIYWYFNTLHFLPSLEYSICSHKKLHFHLRFSPPRRLLSRQFSFHVTDVTAKKSNSLGNARAWYARVSECMQTHTQARKNRFPSYLPHPACGFDYNFYFVLFCGSLQCVVFNFC